MRTENPLLLRHGKNPLQYHYGLHKRLYGTVWFLPAVYGKKSTSTIMIFWHIFIYLFQCPLRTQVDGDPDAGVPNATLKALGAGKWQAGSKAAFTPRAGYALQDDLKKEFTNKTERVMLCRSGNPKP
jgi:hypothetical protein